MTKVVCCVPDVPGLCRVLCRVVRHCAGCAGSITYARTRKNSATPTPHKHALMRICTRHTRHTRHMLDSYTFFRTSPGTRSGTPGTDTLALAPNPIFFISKKKMEEKSRTRTIRCTPENAREMQQMVKNWPELHALVQHLQSQDLFPGLRGLSVTLTGPESFVAGGIAAVDQLNAVKRE